MRVCQTWVRRPLCSGVQRPMTLVPVGASPTSEGEETATEEAGEAPVTTPAEEGTEEATAEPTKEEASTPETSEGEATAEPTSEEEAGEEATATSEPEDEELAQTGVGWGLVVASGTGLAALAVAARRLRLTG